MTRFPLTTDAMMDRAPFGPQPQTLDGMSDAEFTTMLTRLAQHRRAVVEQGAVIRTDGPLGRAMCRVMNLTSPRCVAGD